MKSKYMLVLTVFMAGQAFGAASNSTKKSPEDIATGMFNRMRKGMHKFAPGGANPSEQNLKIIGQVVGNYINNGPFEQRQAINRNPRLKKAFADLQKSIDRNINPKTVPMYHAAKELFPVGPLQLSDDEPEAMDVDQVEEMLNNLGL